MGRIDLKGRTAVVTAGAKMNRRILGLAHNLDLESIDNLSLRAACEARALTLDKEPRP